MACEHAAGGEPRTDQPTRGVKNVEGVLGACAFSSFLFSFIQAGYGSDGDKSVCRIGSFVLPGVDTSSTR